MDAEEALVRRLSTARKTYFALYIVLMHRTRCENTLHAGDTARMVESMLAKKDLCSRLAAKLERVRAERKMSRVSRALRVGFR